MDNVVGKFFVQNKTSTWIAMLIAIISGVMMRPSFAAVICIVLILALLFLLKWVAHEEGKAKALNK